MTLLSLLTGLSLTAGYDLCHDRGFSCNAISCGNCPLLSVQTCFDPDDHILEKLNHEIRNPTAD